jgi:methyl-accepting chemotaxis protein
VRRLLSNPSRTAVPSQTAAATSDDRVVDLDALAALLDLVPYGCAVLDGESGETLYQNAAGQAAQRQLAQSDSRTRQQALDMIRSANAAGGEIRDSLTVENGHSTRIDVRMRTLTSGRRVCLVAYRDVTKEVTAAEQADRYRERMGEIGLVSQSMQAAASATEEMAASIQEIARNSTEAASNARSAVQVAEGTTSAVARLGEAGAEISKIVKVIGSIAAQTNLLALNATIEAARAGAAGQGFAVVANEVKDLARETAAATDEISQMIESVQTETETAVEAMQRITSVIESINQIQASIAAAVEEQTATTTDISTNVTSAAQRAEQIVSFLGAMG